MTNDQWLAHSYYERDPLPEVPPALLNSMDIKRYIDNGCLIDPDEFDKDALQPASYQMKFLGEAHYWDYDNGVLKRKRQNLREGKKFEIKKNSVIYVLLKEQFRLPEYIIARFNLHIKFVHKGLLLGTGPMVHPGFIGKLLIPLHNLTDNDYVVECGDPLILVEFTKLSGNSYWGNAVTMSEMELQGHLERHERPEFLIKGKTIPQHSAYEYLNKADVFVKRGVQSAFKGALDRTEYAASTAREETERLKRFFTWAGLASGFVILVSVGALIISIGALIYQGYSLMGQVVEIGQVVDLSQGENRRQTELNRIQQSGDIDANQKRIADLETRANLYRTEIEKLKGKINSHNSEMETLNEKIDSIKKD